ncbi:MAG TPA: DNA polymerase IV [Gemmatimonadaceae bacterium]|jgi:DNA polymerase-4|nr:DNA polymerase IV [Gemmatimonadaceae bacterium]
MGPTPPARRVLLADCDQFFVAVARLVDPEGAGAARLLIVGGSRESRGVVCSASYEVRQYGVRSGMPISRALRLCPDAMCVPVPRKACSEKSRAVAVVLRRFAPIVEAASVDELYLDLTNTERLYHDEPLTETAARIREAVGREAGISVSIGGGTSKLVAKLAVEKAKPRPGTGANGVYVVAPGDEAEFLLRCTLADLPGVGPRFQERLARLGWETVADVVALDRAALVRNLGEREAHWLYDRVRGIDPTPVRPRGQVKSVSRDETFARDISDPAAMKRELLRLVDRAAGDLRDAGLAARTITVKLRDADWVTRQASRTVPHALTTDRAIAPIARALFARLRAERRTAARLIGVSLSTFDDAAQLDLLDDRRELKRDRDLARAVDAVRERYGHDAITPGILAEAPKPRR